MSDPSEPTAPAPSLPAQSEPVRIGRAVALGIAAMGLLGLVALASQGPLLAARTHDRQGHLAAWTTNVLALIVAVGGGAALLYAIVSYRRDERDHGKGGAWTILIIVAIAFVAATFIRRGHDTPVATTPSPTAVAPVHGAAPPPKPASKAGGSGATWWVVLLLSSAAVVALTAASRSGRAAARARARDRAQHRDPLVALVDDSLDDLRAEPDPRRAVIAAYARMERGLGAGGLVRAPAETAPEYLARVLAERRVSDAAATRLTRLFEQAKFSDHLIGPDAKHAAITALEAVRDELRGELRDELRDEHVDPAAPNRTGPT